MKWKKNNNSHKLDYRKRNYQFHKNYVVFVISVITYGHFFAGYFQWWLLFWMVTLFVGYIFGGSFFVLMVTLSCDEVFDGYVFGSYVFSGYFFWRNFFYLETFLMIYVVWWLRYWWFLFLTVTLSDGYVFGGDFFLLITFLVVTFSGNFFLFGNV